MGSRITKLQPVGGFAAETAAAVTLAFATYGGIPVSTTHTITGCDRRRRGDPKALGGAMGGRPKGGLGLGLDDPGAWAMAMATYYVGLGVQLMDRRGGFFLIAALLGAVLTPIADPEHRWVAIAVTVTYVVFAAASWADARTRRRYDP